MIVTMPTMTQRPPRDFFRRDPVTLARALLGQRLVRVTDSSTRISGIIVETEAYLGIPDLAAHTTGGRRTARNASMWLDGGHSYVYFTYGMHHCMNIVTQTPDEPTAVLIRALQPEEGLDLMRLHRGDAAKRNRDLCSGPAKLCQALDIDRSLDGIDLCTGSALFIEQIRHRPFPDSVIATGPRIGVGYAKEWAEKPLRFWLRGNEHVSR